MIEPFLVAVFVLGLLYSVSAAAHHIAWWSMSTPRSGYLILAIFALFILIRSLP
jgi:hypothetical protein